MLLLYKNKPVKLMKLLIFFIDFCRQMCYNVIIIRLSDKS